MLLSAFSWWPQFWMSSWGVLGVICGCLLNSAPRDWAEEHPWALLGLTGTEFRRGFSESHLHRCWTGHAPIKLPASDLKCLQDLLRTVVRQRSQGLNVLIEVLLVIYSRDLNPFIGLSHRLGSVTWKLRADCYIFMGTRFWTDTHCQIHDLSVSDGKG